MRYKKLLIGLAITAFLIAVSPYAAIFGSMALESGKEFISREMFDSAAWQDPKQINEQTRIRMVDDLLHAYDLNLKTESEVEKLLGKSGNTPYFSDWDMVYWLGAERSFISIDSEWLVLRLNEELLVVEYRLVRD